MVEFFPGSLVLSMLSAPKRFEFISLSLSAPLCKAFYLTYLSCHKMVGTCPVSCGYLALALDYPFYMEICESYEKFFPAKIWWVAGPIKTFF